MKLVYTHQNAILVQNAKNMLVNEGVPVVLKNEHLAGGMGELSAIDGWLELWLLEAADEARAMAVLQCLDEPQVRTDWQCTYCRETNYPSFGLCWNCQQRKK
ncbi:DUF2007 domain-containing protein [Marinagarivorans algicola]|uniref:putative signal transducing protein n=1 Tax=Marinagarivorans algicola TaxID=1513270 RepID=UPI0006B60009|nr:DUF2007 domain-containing protein [Marinagarivorans algicola]